MNSPIFVQQESYILGYFNTDILAKKNSLKLSLGNFQKSFDLSQLKEKTICITNTSATAIDLVFTSEPEKVTQSGVLPCKISDHNVIFWTRKVTKYHFNKHSVTQIRSMKHYDVQDFRNKLNELDWYQVIYEENVDVALKRFNMFLEVVDNVAPLKTVRLKQNCDPWFFG